MICVGTGGIDVLCHCWVRTGDWKLYNDGRLFHMNSDLQEDRPINAKNDTPASKSARQDLEKALAELKNSPQK